MSMTHEQLNYDDIILKQTKARKSWLKEISPSYKLSDIIYDEKEGEFIWCENAEGDYARRYLPDYLIN